MTLTQIKPAGLSKPVDLADNEKIRLGTGNDLEIYHDGSNSRIKDTGQGNLIVNASRFDVVNVADNEYIATFAQDGAVELYHNGSKKFQTNGAGVDVFQNLYLGDNVNLKFGTGADLQIFHNGTHSRLINSTGNLELAGSQIDITDTALSQYAARFDTNDSVDLYFNGSKKFETISDGVAVTGTLETTTIEVPDGTSGIQVGNSNDLRLRHDGTDSRIINYNSDLYLYTTGQYAVRILADSQNAVLCLPDAAVELYYDNSKKFETSSTGATVTGTLNATNTNITTQMFMPDNGQIRLGNSDDLQIYHDGGSWNYIKSQNSKNLTIQVNDENAFIAIPDSATQLYYDNAKKLETRSNGVTVTGSIITSSYGQNGYYSGLFGKIRVGADVYGNTIKTAGDANFNITANSSVAFNLGANTDGSDSGTLIALFHTGGLRPATNNAVDLGTTTYRWRNIYTNDLNLSNEGSSNDMDGSWGNWTIQEGESDLFLKNNRSGKKYKFNLTEVS